MANFFEAWAGINKSQAVMASNHPSISTLQITSNIGIFGIWGGDASSNWLNIKVYRASTVVNVKVDVLLEVPSDWVRVIRVTGLQNGDEIYGMTKLGQRYTTVLTVRTVSSKSNDIIQDWANHLKTNLDYKPTQAGLCPIAIPYLALKDGKNSATKLEDNLIGDALSIIHGLAIHTTGAGGGRNEFQTAIYGCVQVWNKDYTESGNRRKASTHFAIASNGKIVQIVQTSHKAWAQGLGDRNWISVEIDNNGRSPMKVEQLDAVKRLFEWVCRTYGIPRQLAIGTLYSNRGFPHHDEITTTVCAASGSQVTRSPLWAVMSRGLSCHYWLDDRNGKPCPGEGILRQMASIVKPGAVC